jgi:hypothetical protein
VCGWRRRRGELRTHLVHRKPVMKYWKVDGSQLDQFIADATSWNLPNVTIGASGSYSTISLN